jgi:hypothetical protein
VVQTLAAEALAQISPQVLALVVVVDLLFCARLHAEQADTRLAA